MCIRDSPDYGRLSQVNSEFPVFDQIETEIRILLSNIQNIMMGEDKRDVYKRQTIHRAGQWHHTDLHRRQITNEGNHTPPSINPHVYIGALEISQIVVLGRTYIAPPLP